METNFKSGQRLYRAQGVKVRRQCWGIEKKTSTDKQFSIRYIGKESNELEESDIVGVTEGNYAKYLNLREVILGIDVYKEHKKIGVSKSNLFELQKKAKTGEKLKLQKETLSKILNYMHSKNRKF